MGRPRKTSREVVLVTKAFSVALDDLRPDVGYFTNHEDAFTYAKQNMKVRPDENLVDKAKAAVHPIVKKALKPLPVEE